MIKSRACRILLTAVYHNGTNIILSSCRDCTFIGNAATGNLAIRLDNLQASNGGAYIHVVDRTDNVRGCITLFILGKSSFPMINKNKQSELIKLINEGILFIVSLIPIKLVHSPRFKAK